MLSGGDYRFFLKMCLRHDQSYRARERERERKMQQVRSGVGGVFSLSMDGELPVWGSPVGLVFSVRVTELSLNHSFLFFKTFSTLPGRERERAEGGREAC